jgi:tetratricopeptide (TPR) repeat protein
VLQLSAKSYYDFNETCVIAYNDIIALKLDNGRHALDSIQQLEPNNLIPVLLRNYIDFLEVYTEGSEEIYESKKKRFDQNLDDLKKGDKDSPYYLYAQAEVHTQSAVLHIKFGEYLATIFDVKKALKKLENNQDSFPEFVPNKKSLGMLYTILGSIPQQYQNTLEFIGLHGEVSKGLGLLGEAVNDHSHPFQHEAATIQAFMLLHIQNDPKTAWEVLRKNSFNAKTNLMDAFAFGHIGIHGSHCDEGIQALLDAPRSPEYSSFPLISFLLGIGKTYRQDGDANKYFQQFIDRNKGEDYVKSAWHKMAWNELIRGNHAKYNSYMQNVSSSGRAVIDTDKQAEKELESTIPNPILLKARLMTDGNYLTKAQNLLADYHVNSFKNKYEKTEYFYRLARIFDKKGEVKKAIQYYEITIANGRSVPFYYAANAAYLLGFLYEEAGNLTEATKNYTLCLDLDGHEYENSIHQKAEAALNRLKY